MGDRITDFDRGHWFFLEDLSRHVLLQSEQSDAAYKHIYADDIVANVGVISGSHRDWQNYISDRFDEGDHTTMMKTDLFPHTTMTFNATAVTAEGQKYPVHMTAGEAGPVVQTFAGGECRRATKWFPEL